MNNINELHNSPGDENWDSGNDNQAGAHQVRTMSEPVQTQVRTGSHQWLTVDEAFIYLAKNGLTRSRKTIRKRYQSGGFALVDKERTSNGYRWVIAQSALDAYIEDAKAQEAILLEHESHESNQVRTQVQTPNEPVRTNDQTGAHPGSDEGSELEKLRKEVVDLRIAAAAANQARDIVTKQVTEMRKELATANYALGDAEAQLKALEAPRASGAGDAVENRVGDSGQNDRIRDV